MARSGEEGIRWRTARRNCRDIRRSCARPHRRASAGRSPRPRRRRSAAASPSGSIASRLLVAATLVTAVVYAVPVHWVWSDDGCLSPWNEGALLSTGVIDFAGSGLVHMVGGVAGLVGSVMLGPRLGRFPRARLADARTAASSGAPRADDAAREAAAGATTCAPSAGTTTRSARSASTACGSAGSASTRAARAGSREAARSSPRASCSTL